jgi:hypothetical protein
MEAEDEVDYEAPMESEGTSSQVKAAGSKAPMRDAAGRRLKGRGGSASGQTMQEDSGYDRIESKGGGAKGPAKCVHPG